MRIGSRKAQAFELAGAGQEPGFRILRIQAHFDGVTVLADLVLLQWQRFVCRNTQLPFDQVQARHILGDRMLDLQARVDLHEVEATVLTDDEFHRAGVDVVDGACGGNRGRAHGLT